jgi:hypothetical protein
MVPAPETSDQVGDALLIAASILLAITIGYFAVTLVFEKYLSRRDPGVRGLLLQARPRRKQKRKSVKGPGSP